MAEVSPPGDGGWKNVIVLAVIWIAIIGALLSSSSIRDAFFGIFSSDAPDNFSDVIIISQDGEARNTAFHSKGKPDVYDIIQSPANNRVFFAGTSIGLFVSNDSGNNWFQIKLPSELGEAPVIYNLTTNPQNTFEISMIVFQENKAVVYKTRDNFFSLQKEFEIDSTQLGEVAAGRNISNIISSDGLNIVGTRK